VGIWFVKSFINADQADFMVLEDTIYTSSRKICLLVNLKYQIGGEIQNGHQIIVHKNANYWKLFNLLAYLKNIILLSLFFFKLGRPLYERKVKLTFSSFFKHIIYFANIFRGTLNNIIQIYQ
jgi:hypothetical protein